MKIINQLVVQSDMPNDNNVVWVYGNTAKYYNNGTWTTLGDKDIINISNKYDEHYISLSEAINLVPELQRKNGLFITFQDVNGNWQFYQFRGTLEEFSEKDKWFNLDFEEYLKETLIPITNIEIDNLSK